MTSVWELPLWKTVICAARLEQQQGFCSWRCYQGNNKAGASSVTLSDSFCCCSVRQESVLICFAFTWVYLIGVTAAIPELCWCNRARSGPQPAPVPQGIAAKMDWLTLQVHFHVNVLALAPVNIGSVICTALHVWWHTQWVTAPKPQLFWSGGLAVSVDAKSRLQCYCSSCIWGTPKNNKNR